MGTPASSTTVLIVEDERDLADLYATWMSDTYEVRTAYSGSEALQELDESVDVVLLDRRMPDVSGDEVLTSIRERELSVRVVVVSAVDPDFDVVELGFDDYLVKPVDSADLHDVVERMEVRLSYDDSVDRLLQLLSTKAVLEVEKTEAELEASEEYQDLCERIREVEAQAEEYTAQFDEEDYTVAFRDLGADADDEKSDEE